MKLENGKEMMQNPCLRFKTSLDSYLQNDCKVKMHFYVKLSINYILHV